MRGWSSMAQSGVFPDPDHKIREVIHSNAVEYAVSSVLFSTMFSCDEAHTCFSAEGPKLIALNRRPVIGSDRYLVSVAYGETVECFVKYKCDRHSFAFRHHKRMSCPKRSMVFVEETFLIHLYDQLDIMCGCC